MIILLFISSKILRRQILFNNKGYDGVALFSDYFIYVYKLNLSPQEIMKDEKIKNKIK